MRDMRERKDVYEYVSDEENEQPSAPNVVALACGPDAEIYDFGARTRSHDKVTFAYAELCGGRLLLYDGELRGIEGDKRELFDILEIEPENLVWLTARRK